MTKYAFIIDPIEQFKIAKDTTFAMLLECQRQGIEIFTFLQQDLYLEAGQIKGIGSQVTVFDDPAHWVDKASPTECALIDFDCILMRQDPPFNMAYIYTTYLLELVERQGVRVVNKPQSLRDANEKLYTAWFDQCCVATMVSRRQSKIVEFIATHQDVILKPLSGMGGQGIFRVTVTDVNVNVIIETVSENGAQPIMAQCFIPEIMQTGDKRIILIDGKPVPYAFARFPKAGETRANIAAGGTGKVVELSARDRWICQEVGPVLLDKGLRFVGLDVIGDYLTEVNVTSPTCVREIEKATGLNVCEQFITAIAQDVGK